MSVDIWGVTIKTSKGDCQVNVHDDFGQWYIVKASEELVSSSDPDELATVIAHAMISVRKAKSQRLIVQGEDHKVFPV